MSMAHTLKMYADVLLDDTESIYGSVKDAFALQRYRNLGKLLHDKNVSRYRKTCALR
jgi:hypothetical protein